MTRFSKRNPYVSGSISRSFFPAPRKYAPMAGSVRYLTGLLRMAVLDLSLGFQAGVSSDIWILFRYARYSYTVFSEICCPCPFISFRSVSMETAVPIFLESDFNRALSFSGFLPIPSWVLVVIRLSQ